MKKVIINTLSAGNKTSIISRDRKHSISLGNGVNAVFTNIAAARRFLAESNKFLNHKLHDVNEIYIELITIFNRQWFALTWDQERDILENLEAFPRMRKIMVSRSGWDNGNHLVFKNLNVSLDYFDQVIKILARSNKTRKRNIDNYYLNCLDTRIQLIRDQIENYGGEYDLPRGKYFS